VPGDALADRGIEVGDVRDRQSGVAGGIDDGAAERVLGGALDTCGGPEQLVASNPRAATVRVSEGRPSVRVPVLSTTSVFTFSIRSSASAFLINTPRPAQARLGP
jgi:hypothetical protein